MTRSLKGRTAVVTGGASGIGLFTVQPALPRTVAGALISVSDEHPRVR